ncbi:MAG: DUF1579 family protein [Planctomycetota bacterium]
MFRKLILAPACLSIVLSSVLTAQESDVNPAEVYEKLSKPGPEHAKLKMRVGNWKVAATFFTPGAPPMKSEATSNVRPLFGGRYLVEKYKGSVFGKSFDGQGIIGFDKGKKKYCCWYHWIRSRLGQLWSDCFIF